MTSQLGVVAFVAVVLVSGCGGDDRDRVAEQKVRFVPAKVARKDTRPLDVRPGGAMPPVAYLSGRLLRDGGSQAGTPIAVDDGSGCLGASAVLLEDRRLLVTQVIARRDNGMDVPQDRVRLQVVDPRAERSEVVADPACNPAVSSSGRLAYVAGERPSAPESSTFRGRIMVRRTPASRPAPWTEVGAWCYPQWAGSRLLVKTCADDGGGELFVLDSPGQRRSIGGPGDLGQPSATVLAVSPDGRLAAVAGQRVTAASTHPTVSIVRIADGRVLAALDTEAAIGAGLETDGHWRDSRIVAVTSYCCGDTSSPAPAVVVLRYRAGRLALRRIAPIDYEDVGGTGQNRPSADQPRLVGPSTVGVWLGGRRMRWLTCDLVASACRAGPVVPAGTVDGLDPPARLVALPGS